MPLKPSSYSSDDKKAATVVDSEDSLLGNNKSSMDTKQPMAGFDVLKASFHALSDSTNVFVNNV